jgi:3-dehydroquinate dehydratase-1
MTARKSVKVVGVITNLRELDSAARMKSPPDLFEVRLDHFATVDRQLERKMSILPAPVIVTARHPAEGGAHNLSLKRRRECLLRALPYAGYVDVELRSIEAFEDIIPKNIHRIISFHDFKSTPPTRTLIPKARQAKQHGAAVFKVATRTDTSMQLERLFDFIANPDVDLALSVMGIGKLGLKSRRELMRLGSVLNYASLGRARIPGQPSLAEIRRWVLAVER